MHVSVLRISKQKVQLLQLEIARTELESHLDTVVNHLDVVSSSGISNPVAARLTVGLSGSLLEDFLDVRPGSSGTSGHERRTVTSSLLTSRDTRSDEKETLGLELLGAADRVGEVRVSSIDDDVSLLEVRFKLTDEVVDSLTGLDEKDDLARSLQLGAKFLNGVSTDDRLACDRCSIRISF